MLFDLQKVGRMTTAQMKEIINAYTSADSSVVPPVFANNKERANFIEETAARLNGFPHELTEDDMAANSLYATEELQAGDLIILPFPDPEKEAREAMLEQVTVLINGLAEEDIDAFPVLEEVAELDTESLANLANDLVAHYEAISAAKAAETSEDDESITEEASDETEATGDVEDLIQKAVKTGKLRFENHLIIGVRPKIANGRLRYEMDATDGSSYLATKEELETVIKEALAVNTN